MSLKERRVPRRRAGRGTGVKIRRGPWGFSPHRPVSTTSPSEASELSGSPGRRGGVRAERRCSESREALYCPQKELHFHGEAKKKKW